MTKRKFLKKEEDLKRLATTDDFITFDKSEPVRRAVKILSELMASKRPVLKAEFSCVRDYILTAMHQDRDHLLL